jgi:hypothetical protein
VRKEEYWAHGMIAERAIGDADSLVGEEGEIKMYHNCLYYESVNMIVLWVLFELSRKAQ